MSDHLVRGVDFLFALTLGQGILLFRSFWIQPALPQHWPVVLALVSVYATTFTSFIDWHLAMESKPYVVDRSRTTHHRTEWCRVWIDLLTVMVYAYMLVNATTLIATPGHSLSSFLIGFPIIFICYGTWVGLRRAQYEDRPGRRLCLITTIFLTYTALWAVYTTAIHHGHQANEIVLIIATILVVVYRIANRSEWVRS